MSTINQRLVIAISSRALFELPESTTSPQLGDTQSILKPGAAFPLAQKLLSLNSPHHRLIDIVLLSNSSAEVGLRVFSALHHLCRSVWRTIIFVERYERCQTSSF
jgi:5'-nucleotidase